MGDIVSENLCVFDPRSDVYIDFDEEDNVAPRNNCYCDRCFSGRDRLAVEIDRLRAFIADHIHDTPVEEMMMEVNNG